MGYVDIRVLTYVGAATCVLPVNRTSEHATNSYSILLYAKVSISKWDNLTTDCTLPGGTLQNFMLIGFWLADDHEKNICILLAESLSLHCSPNNNSSIA